MYFLYKKITILLLQRARSVGVGVNHRDPSGKRVEIPGVTISTPSEQPVLDFPLLLLPWKSRFAARWEDLAGSELALVVSGGQAGSSPPASRGSQSPALFSRCGNSVEPFPLQAVLEAAQENTDVDIFAWLWSVLILQGPALRGTRGGDEVSPPERAENKSWVRQTIPK